MHARHPEAARQWAAIDTVDLRRSIANEVRRRQKAGQKNAAKKVALEMLEEVWIRTHFRRLANLAYRRTLAIGLAAADGGAPQKRPARIFYHPFGDRA